MLGAVQTVLTLVSLYAIVVGAFIIYHTMRTAIRQRQRDFALARAIGYSRGDLLGVVAMEAMLFGAVGAVLGTVLAHQAARLSLGIVTSGISSVWARIDQPALQLTLRDFATACGLGITMSLVAAVAPARDIMRMHVVEQLRGVSEEQLPGAAARAALWWP